MTICYIPGYILDIPQRGALIFPRSGIEIYIYIIKYGST